MSLPALQHATQFTKRADRMFDRKPYEARRICIINAEQEPLYRGRNQVCRCAPGGRHYTRSKVVGMVATGEMRWAGKDKNVAYFVSPKTWEKVYQRNRMGEVVSCNMQMVPGGLL